MSKPNPMYKHGMYDHYKNTHRHNSLVAQLGPQIHSPVPLTERKKDRTFIEDYMKLPPRMRHGLQRTFYSQFYQTLKNALNTQEKTRPRSYNKSKKSHKMKHHSHGGARRTRRSTRRHTRRHTRRRGRGQSSHCSHLRCRCVAIV